MFASITEHAVAQDEEVVQLQKITVTGSNIPRSDVETALPVQVITREEIDRTGATTVPELMSKVSANIVGFNDQLSIGNSTQPGLASANLRALGDGSTLVLLNGRRIANYAFNGGTVDLNTIPLAAIERVEILKDGASAIYGTDAIAGVINFILRKDFRGLVVSGYGAWTQHGGGDQQQATLTAGYGDLAKDRFNIFGTIDYQKDDALAAAARPFSRTAYLPDEGVNLLSRTTFPANITVRSTVPGGRSTLVNPSYANGCAPPVSIPLADAPGQTCYFDFASVIDTIPPVQRLGAVGRATFALDADNQIFAEGNYAANQFRFSVAPTPVPAGLVSYPAGGPFYPTAFANANGLTGDLPLAYRTVPLGPRNNETDSDAWRAVVGAEGFARGWNYHAALSYSRSDQSDNFVSGNVSSQRLQDAMATGLINPFGPSGSQGDALLASTQITGEIHHATGSTLLIDVTASDEIFTLQGGPLAIAVGAEARRERLDNQYAPVFTSGDVIGAGGDQQSVGGSRTVEAIFIEASVPFAKGFEAQLAARYDHYSDFGNTVNPKVALRWQPLRTLLLRSSWGTGFRAPTLPDLFTPPTHSLVDGIVDPIRCPITGYDSDCAGGANLVTGGNPNLKPETSEQFNAGMVWDPIPRLSLTVDYWRINQSGVIGTLSSSALFGNYGQFAPTHITRGPADPAFPNLPGPIDTIVVLNENLGNLRTSGIDVGVNWRSSAMPIGRFSFALNGTYIVDWKKQLDRVNYVSGLGQLVDGIVGPIPWWKHHLAFGWDYGPWGATLDQTYQTGYEDANVDGNGQPLPVPPRRVAPFDVWDLQGRYTGFRNTTLVVGIKNLMDRAPPFSNQPFSFQVGYDPIYADPRGRMFYGRLTFAFK